MKRFKRRVGNLVSLLFLVMTSLIPVATALAVASMAMSVNNMSATSYTSVPFIANTSNDVLIGSGQMLPTGLDVRVTSSNGTSLPIMLADNYTLFVGDSPAHTSSQFTLTTGNTPVASMPIIVGNSGNVTTLDATNLELGSIFDVSISGYINTTNGTGKNLLYKDGAAKLDVSAASTITWHALNADNSDNWTMSTAAVSAGLHTVRIQADGQTARLYLDGTEITNHSMLMNIGPSTINSGSISAVGTDSVVVYANGLYWFFYSLAADYHYRAMDVAGNLKADQSGLGTAHLGSNPFGVATNYFYSDPAYIGYYIRHTGDNSYFVRGAASTNGTVTWGAEQNFQNNDYSYGLAFDDNWYPYMTAGSYGGQSILKSSTNDGTYSASGSPYPVGVGDNVYLTNMMAGKMYAWYSNSGSIKGRYYNGTTWASAETIVSSTVYNESRIVCGTDNTLWFSGRRDGVDGYFDLYKKPLGGSWTLVNNNIWSEVNGNTEGRSGMTINLDTNALTFMMCKSVSDTTLTRGLYKKTYDVTSGLSARTTIYSTDHPVNYAVPQLPFFFRSSTGLPWMLQMESGNLYAGIVDVPSWSWLDNANNWTLMAGNSMPYADNITISASGIQNLLYRPNNIISGNTLPDLSAGGNNGIISWGGSTLAVSGSALVTLPATNITISSATLNGQLLDMAGAASYSVYFDYGLTVAYGLTTPFTTMSSPGLLSANVSGLFNHTTYHFRAVAVSANISLYGGDLTFLTLGSSGGGAFQIGGGNARVFKNYLADNDTLVTAELVNTYLPYYPNQSPKEFFTVQLIDTDNTTILAATPQQDWGDKPIGIYINPVQSRNLTNGANYYVRIQGNFASNVTAQYQLKHLPWDNDWKGSDLTKLDDWSVYVAMNMQTFYSGGGYVTVLTDRKLAITDAVGGYFTAGIAGIGQVRPNLFTTSQQTPTFTAGISALPADNTTAYTAYVGSTIANDANDLGVPFGMTGRDMLAGALALAMLGVIMTGTAAMGGFGALGLFLISIPILWLGTYFKVVGVQYIMVLTIIFGFLFVRQFWIKTT